MIDPDLQGKAGWKQSHTDLHVPQNYFRSLGEPLMLMVAITPSGDSSGSKP